MHSRKRPGLPDRRNLGPHRTAEPLRGPRNCRERPRGLYPKGKRAVTPPAAYPQQRLTLLREPTYYPPGS